MALIDLAIACWPGPPPLGMMTYSALVTLYVAYLGFTGYSGILLLPVIILQVILTVLFARSHAAASCNASLTSGRKSRAEVLQ